MVVMLQTDAVSRARSPQDPVAEFAAELRVLRQSAGSPGFDQMARRTHASRSTLHSAAEVRRLPTWQAVEQFVSGCDGDVIAWHARWQHARDEHALLSTQYSERPEDRQPPGENEPHSKLWVALAFLVAFVPGALSGLDAVRQHAPLTVVATVLLGLMCLFAQRNLTGPRFILTVVVAATVWFGVANSVSAPGESDEPPVKYAAEAPLQQYLHEGGGRPARTPPPEGLFGLRLGSPAGLVLAQLGPESSRYAGSQEGSLVREWQHGSMNFSVETDAAEAVRSISVTRYGATEGDPWRAALPEGLVLGSSTMGDVLKVRGPPEMFQVNGVNGGAEYAFRYRQGPEGSQQATYSLLLDKPPVKLVAPPSTDLLKRYLVTFYQIEE